MVQGFQPLETKKKCFNENKNNWIGIKIQVNCKCKKKIIKKTNK